MFIVLKYKCHGVSVLMVLVSLSQQAATLKSSFSSPYSTGADDDEDNNEERRGGGQDGDEDSGPSPRPALHEDLGSAFTKLAARKRKDRLLSAQKDPFLAELGDDVCSQDPLRALTGGCWRPPEEHREPRPLAPAASSARPRDSSPATRPAGRGTASGPPAIATCNILGYTSRSQLSSGCGVRSTPPDGVYRLHGGEARQPGLRPARQPLQQLPDCQESPRHRHGSEDPSWGRQCSGIVCCFRHNNNALSTRGPLCSEECSQQHLSLPSAGARPCSRAGAPRVSSRSSRGTATTPTRTCGTASRSRRSRRSGGRPWQLPIAIAQRKETVN